MPQAASLPGGASSTCNVKAAPATMLAASVRCVGAVGVIEYLQATPRVCSLLVVDGHRGGGELL